ncbi:MAG: class I SAM-dependent methyltransferase [Hyphomicrobiales bacterium]
MTEIADAFGGVAKQYDQARSALIPDYDHLYGNAVAALSDHLDAGGHVLDIGTGTGAFASELANAEPKCTFLLSDISHGMLNEARKKFDGDARFDFMHGDITGVELPGPFDAVKSSFVIHHFSHEDKANVFSSVAQALKPGGLFVNIDQFTTGHDHHDAQLRADWERDVRKVGIDEGDLTAAIDRMDAFDQNASIDDQLTWMLEGGFKSAEITYKNYFWGVFVART